MIKLAYSRLEDAPLPEVIYNPPLDERIEPLIRALTLQGVITTGSCEGHIEPGRWKYPWVATMQTDPGILRTCQYLVKHHNEKGKVQWRMDECRLYTYSEARSYAELVRLQKSAGELADILFRYRPEVLDGIPTPQDRTEKEQAKITKKVDRVYAQLYSLLTNPVSPERKRSIQMKFKEFEELFEVECAVYEQLLWFEPKRVAARLKKVKE